MMCRGWVAWRLTCNGLTTTNKLFGRMILTLICSRFGGESLFRGFKMKNTISAVAILTFLLTVAVTSGRAPANATKGAETYKTKCVACHGSDGGGNTPMGQRMKVRDLRSSEVQKQTDDELSAIITNG